MNKDDLKRHQNFRIFGDAQLTPVPNPLNELLLYPFFWKSVKISSFFRDAWNYINIKDGTDAQVDSFREGLKADSTKALPLNNPDWTQVLGGTHWPILQREGAKSTNPGKIRLKDTNGNFKSVVKLLSVIRNKVEHSREFGEEEQAILGWFSNGDFDDHKCVAYWLDNFPKLLPFLWSKYHPFRNCETFKTYYSSTLDNYALGFNWEEETVLQDIISQFNIALDIHLEEGGLEKRYTCTRSSTQPATSFTLEFRILDSAIIGTLLDSASFVEIRLGNDMLTFGWCADDTSGDTINSKYLKYYASNPKVEDIITCVVVANCLKEEYLVSKDTCKKVIFLISENCAPSIESTAKKFADKNNVVLEETPLSWSELPTKRSSIESVGQVSFQNKVVKLSSLLPSSLDARESVLSTLEGSTLNALLKKDKPALFDKYQIPKLVKPYLQRRLCSCREITSKVLRHRFPDKIVVTNIRLEEMQKFVNTGENIFQLETVNDILNTENLLTYRLFCLEGTGQHYNDILKLFKSRLDRDHHDGTNIHCLQFLEEDAFQWLGTFGSLSIIKKSSSKKPTKMVVMDEKEFLENIKSCEPEPIFIADTPGMGKSVVLISLANKMSEMFADNFVIFLNMNEFIAKLEKRLAISKSKQRNCTKDDIIAVIQDAVSTTEFERCLVNSWIQQTYPNTKITLELMLDGLDEVGKKQKDLAIKVFKIIRLEMSTVRLWVTFRQHMQQEIERHFSILSYKIQPFTEIDQVNYLKNYWSNQNERLNSEALESFAVECIRLSNAEIDTTEIAGAPLQCRMLGEIYENYLFDYEDSNFRLESISLTELYEKMIDKKLKDYFSAKMGLPNPPDFMVEMTRKEMESCHINLAKKLIFCDSAENPFIKTLYAKSNEHTDELVGKLGIVENLEPIRFVHRTFAEYFVALFICKVLSEENPLSLDSEEKNRQTFFLSQTLEVAKYQLLQDTIVSKFKAPVLVYFLNAMLEDAKISPNLVNLLAEMYDFNPNMTTFDSSKSIILATIHHNYFHLAQLLLGPPNKEGTHIFLDKTKDKHTLILELSVRFASVDFFKFICSLIEKWHEENGSTHIIAISVFKLALDKGKYAIVKFLVENKGFGADTWHSFHLSDKKQFGIIHHIIGKSRHDKEEVLEEKKKLLEYIVKKDAGTLEQADKEGLTPILTRYSASFSLKSFLITELGANVNAKGIHNNTAFQWKNFLDYRKGISSHQYHEMLKVFLDNGFNQINSVSNIGLSVLQCAINTYYDSLEEETLELFQSANANFNAKYPDGNTILHVCIIKKCRTKFIEKLIQCGCDIWEKNSKGKCALQVAAESGNWPLVKLLKERYGAVDFGVCDNEHEE